MSKDTENNLNDLNSYIKDKKNKSNRNKIIFFLVLIIIISIIIVLEKNFQFFSRIDIKKIYEQVLNKVSN